MKGMETHIVVVAAGSGSRMGSDIPKQYQMFAGKPLLRHTLDALLRMPDIDSVRVVIGAGHEVLYEDAVKGLDLAPPVVGGKSRKESVYNVLESFLKVKNEFKILIHDAARPFVSLKDIEALRKHLDTASAGTLATPVKDTLTRDNGEIVDRDGLWAVQTPQGFHYSVLAKAHETLKDRNDFTDDAALVREMGVEVALISSSSRNFKITTQEDLGVAMELWRANMETRMGTGFDVHAFAPSDGEEAVICGVRIPSPYVLVGHSDADVGLHAITDALLGAIGKGDIGQHFPPSEAKWKGADSATFLQEAHNMVKELGGEIVNIDLTLMCEQPKIGPYRDAMQERVAEILGLEISRINIKATTTEKLGFLGREEGIAAQALANVRLPMQDSA
jgi:2-C-methyl-D-erythritol 4-phosphate cytidylyltransferase/2-C-methyl-D-erythritol 2,4-cyclodiphosphate synthase